MGYYEKQMMYIPAFFNSFAFQFYFLQIVQTLEDRYGEHRGYKEEDEDARHETERKIRKTWYPCKRCFSASFSLGLVTILILFMLYLSLLLFIYFENKTPSPKEETEETVDQIAITIILATFGFKTNKIREWKLIMAI